MKHPDYSRSGLHYVSCVILVIATQAHSLELSVNAGSQLTNNALKTKNNRITELQDHIGLTTFHTQESSRSQLNVDYSFDYENYKKKSQESRLIVNGSAFAYADLQPWLNAKLSHSAKEVLDSPGQPQLASNTDNRHITSASLDFLYTPNNHNNFTITPSITDIHYRDASDIDSTRKGIQAIWMRNINPITEIKLSALHQNIDYVQDEDGDFDQLSIIIVRRLRLLNYRIEVGHNEIRSSFGEKLASPLLELFTELNNGGHVLTAQYSHRVSDTSSGNQNNPLVSSTDGNRSTLDLYQEQQLNLSYLNSGICNRCRASLALDWLKEDYQAQSTENLQEQITSLSLDYQASPLSNIHWLIKHNDTYFPKDINNNYQQVNILLSYIRKLRKNLTVKLDAKYESRNSKIPLNSYSESSSQATLTYYF
ncbi:hypothetical protein [Bacterioplanoides sp.]|uniref:hypothetical protein n=1 Tax=Bacterioplanoides sp. TaxID=2066072 RepID=UPI003AFFC932